MLDGKFINKYSNSARIPVAHASIAMPDMCEH